MKVDSIIFDLDGTLWDSVDGVLYTWNTVIDRHPELRPHITREEQESLMGLQMDQIAQALFKNESQERQMGLMDECCQEENRYLEIHGGNLYPKLRETLELLGRKHRLFIVSNCQKGYIEAFLTAHKLWDVFEGRLCFGDTGKSKGENIAELVNRYGLNAPIYVGDTEGDHQSAVSAGIPFVFASYGFGDVSACDVKIERFEDLISLFE